jgi:sec-independent protein translocase protein TatA
MPSLGPAEILVVLVIALLVFGPNKMPDIARQVGKGFREFRRVQQHLKSELRDVVSEFDSPSSAPSVQPDAVPTLPPKDETASPPAAESELASPVVDAAPAESAGAESAGAESPGPPTPEPDAPGERT